MNNTVEIVRQIKSTSAIVWAVICFMLCKYIALIFFVLAYDKYEKASNYMLAREYDLAQLLIDDAKKNMTIGIWVAVICMILEVAIATVVVIGFGMLLLQGT